LGLPKSLGPLVGQLIAAQTDLEAKMAETRRAVLGEFLTEAKDLIEKNSLTVCPICEQDIDSAAVVERLKLRIEADRQITDAKALVRGRIKALLDQAEPLVSAIATLKKAWQENLQLPFPKEYVDMQSALEGLARLLRSKGVTVFDLSRYEEWLSDLDNLIRTHEAVLVTLDGLIVGEGGGSHRVLLLDTKAMLECLRADATELRKVRNKLRAYESQRATIAALHKHSVDARKAAVRLTLDSVASVANGMYEHIHQGEGIAKSVLSVRDATRASVTLTTDFCGQEENPPPAS
jgi:uncharacterized protein YukE